MPHEFSNQDRWYAENLEPHEGMLRAWLGSRFSSDLDLDDIIQEAYLRVFKAHQVKEIKAPKAEFVLMGQILQDLNLEEKKLLLAKAYGSLPDSGAVIVYDAIIDDDRR